MGPGTDRNAARVGRVPELVVRAVAKDVGGERRSPERRDEQEDNEDPARNRDLVSFEAAPDVLPVASRDYLLDLAQLAVSLDRDGGGETAD